MALIDFAIITALPEELERLKSLLPATEELTDANNTWHRTRLQSSDGVNYEIVLALQDTMGPLDAANLTRGVLDRWDPSYIILVGIAASFHENVKLGDVIVSQQVFYYDPGKATDAGVKYRPEGYPCGLGLIRQVHAVSVAAKEMEDWRKAAQTSAKAKIPLLTIKNKRALLAAQKALEKHHPSIHVGSVASGSLVIASPKKRQELLRLHGKLIGTEMEGAGLMHASFFSREIPVSAIVIKGVSDAGDTDKAKLDALGFWRELGAENSARLVLVIIQRGRLRANRTDQFAIDVTKASPVEVRAVIPTATATAVAFPGFPNLVVPAGPLTKLVIHAKPTAKGKPVWVLEAKLIFYIDGAKTEHVLTAGNTVDYETTTPVDARPIGLYLMTKEPPDRIDFEVRSGSTTKVATYKL